MHWIIIILLANLIYQLSLRFSETKLSQYFPKLKIAPVLKVLTKAVCACLLLIETQHKVTLKCVFNFQSMTILQLFNFSHFIKYIQNSLTIIGVVQPIKLAVLFISQDSVCSNYRQQTASQQCTQTVPEWAIMKVLGESLLQQTFFSFIGPNLRL